MKKKAILMLVLSMIAFSGCSSSGDNASEDVAQNSEQSSASGESEDSSKATEDYSLPQLNGPQKGDTIAIISTTMGDIKVWFFPEYAPKAVENFTTHAKDGYYDNVIFHRVIDNFMIQSGDPEGTGRGGESIWGEEFENETVSNLRNFRGALCMANAGEDTNGSQFYIVQNPDIGDSYKQAFEEQKSSLEGTDEEVAMLESVIDEYIENGGYPSLDGGYTVFGQVYEGMEVVDKIASVKTDDSDKPLVDISIKSITVGEY